MPETSLQLGEAADEADWRALVERGLKGAPWSRLVGKTSDGIAIEPLYREPDVHTATDISGAPGAAPPSFTYQLNVWETGANSGDIWYTTLPSSATSIVFNDNGSASPAFLSSGKSYTWKIQAHDSNGNVATDDRTFSVP